MKGQLDRGTGEKMGGICCAMWLIISTWLITRKLPSGGIDHPYAAFHPGSSATLPSLFILSLTFCSISIFMQPILLARSQSFYSFSIPQFNHPPVWRARQDSPHRESWSLLLIALPAEPWKSQTPSQFWCNAKGYITGLFWNPSGRRVQCCNDPAHVDLKVLIFNLL